MVDEIDTFAQSTPSEAAALAFAEAVRCMTSHRPDTLSVLHRVFLADPLHVGGRVLEGFACVILGSDAARERARMVVRGAARALAARNRGTRDERVMIDALRRATEGRFADAARIIEIGFRRRPTALLPFKIAHTLRFMIGDTPGMLRASRSMMRAWSPNAGGAGYLLGCHAFALEEEGWFDEAELAGHRALSIEQDDVWGLHAISHVHEMRGQVGVGIDWLEARRPTWSASNNFRHHVAWHLALFYLQRGDLERVLDIYDHDICPTRSDDFRDMANAVSLLRRLEHLGLNAGVRWQHLADIASERREDTTLIFSTLHNLIALVEAGDHESIGALMAALAAKADETGEQAAAARGVGLPLAHLLAGWSRPGASGFEALARNLHALGGSKAQRDLFVLELAASALAAGNAQAVRDLLLTRLPPKRHDRLFDAIEAKARTRNSLPRAAGARIGRR